MLSFLNRRSFHLPALLWVCVGSHAFGANWFWDSNGTTAGAGTTPTGTWGTSTFWSTNSGGTVATTAWTAGNTAVFAAGTDASGAYTVTVSGTQSTAGLTVEEGNVTLSGGGITLTSAAVSVTSTASISSLIGGTVGLTKNGAGTLNLSGANTYSGNTNIAQGTVNVTGNQTGATGSWLLLGNESGTINNAATTVNFNSGSTISVASGNSVQLGNNTAGGGFQLQTMNVAGSVTNAGSLAIGRSGVLNINSGGAWTQSGAAGLTTQGGGTAAMTVNTGGSFTYTGSGTFGLTTSTSTSTTTGLNLAGGTFTTGQAIRNTQTSTVSGTQSLITLNNGGTLKLSADVSSLVTTAGAPINLQTGATGTGGVIDTNGFNTTLAVGIADVASQVGKFTKKGGGTLTMTAASTYTGGTTLGNGSGILAISHGSALGTGAIALSKSGTDTGGILQLSNGITVANAINFSSANLLSTTGTAHVVNVSGSNTLSGNLTLTAMGGNGMNLQSDAGLFTVSGNIGSSVTDATRTLSLGGAGNGAVSGIISNNSSTNKVGLEKTGSGTWTLSGANTYTGNTTLTAGTLAVNSSGALSTAGTISFAGGTLRHSASNTTDYSSRFSTGANQAYRVDTNGESVAWATGLASTGGTLNKLGTGSLTMSGSSTYTGATLVSAGTLLVNGSLGGTSGVTVDAAGRLGGTGTINNAASIAVNGTIAAGASIGTLGTGAVSFNNGSTFSYELDSTAVGADLLNVGGALDLNGTVVLDLTDLATAALAANTRFTLISYDGLWNGGVFDGHADGSVFTLGANNWQINYADTSAGLNGGSFDNFVTLTVVPEPTAAVLGSIGLMCLMRRRRI